MYEKRFYRDQFSEENFISFTVQYKETDIWIRIEREQFSEELAQYAYEKVKNLRNELERFIAVENEYAVTLKPYQIKTKAPLIAKEMELAGQQAGVGPMAAVAGAFAQSLGEELCRKYQLNFVIIENGGDIYMHGNRAITVGLYSGSKSIFSKCKFQFAKESLPLGICTSSSKFGHSTSFGNADAVTVICKNASLADAYATALCNQVKGEADLQKILEFTKTVPEILGIIIVLGDKMAIEDFTHSITLRTDTV